MNEAAFINHDGRILPAARVNISPENRSFRFGDGCFETIKLINNRLLLWDFHSERLLSSLKLLGYNIPENFTAAYLEGQVLALAQKNEHQHFARIRLTFYRGNGSLYDFSDNQPHFIIQSWAGDIETLHFNATGISVDFFTPARKSCDSFSAIKSNNFLPYVMAALWARTNHLAEAIIYNSHERIAEGTISNIFLVDDRGVIKTPSLSEGCIAGVMRRYLLQQFKLGSVPIFEAQLTREDVLTAREVFLTNANYGLRAVKNVGAQYYRLTVSKSIFEQYVGPLFEF